MATQQSEKGIQPNAFTCENRLDGRVIQSITVRESRFAAAFLHLPRGDAHLNVAEIRWLCQVLTQYADAYVEKAVEAVS